MSRGNCEFYSDSPVIHTHSLLSPALSKGDHGGNAGRGFVTLSGFRLYSIGRYKTHLFFYPSWSCWLLSFRVPVFIYWFKGCRLQAQFFVFFLLVLQREKYHGQSRIQEPGTYTVKQGRRPPGNRTRNCCRFVTVTGIPYEAHICAFSCFYDGNVRS